MERQNLNSLGEVKKTSNPSQVRFNCPYCNDEDFHLYIHLLKRVFICHRCKVSGRITNLKPTLDRFQDRVNAILNKPEPNEPAQLLLPLGSRPVLPTSGLPYRYLRRRLVTPPEIKRYELRYCAHGVYAERIIIPIYDGNTLVYYTARTYTNGHPKYLNASVHKGGTIFKTFKGSSRKAIIVEGCFGAMRVAKAFPSIALLGKDPNPKKVLRIVELENLTWVHVMLDPDAHEVAFKLCTLLSHYIKATMTLTKKCPDEMNEKEIREVLPLGFLQD